MFLGIKITQITRIAYKKKDIPVISMQFIQCQTWSDLPSIRG